MAPHEIKARHSHQKYDIVLHNNPTVCQFSCHWVRKWSQQQWKAFQHVPMGFDTQHKENALLYSYVESNILIHLIVSHSKYQQIWIISCLFFYNEVAGIPPLSRVLWWISPVPSGTSLFSSFVFQALCIYTQWLFDVVAWVPSDKRVSISWTQGWGGGG